MNDKRRLTMIVLVGLLFCGLILHNLYSFRVRTALEYESVDYLMNQVPGGPMLAGGVSFLVMLVVVGFVFWIHSHHFASTTPKRKVLPVFLGLSFLVAGFALVWTYADLPVPQEWSALVAVPVGLWLVSLMLSSSTRGVFTVTLAAVVLVVAVITWRSVGVRGAGTDELRAVLERTRQELARQQALWDQLDVSEVLEDASRHAERLGVYRFDEHLQDVVELEAQEPEDGGGVLYEIPRDGKLIPVDRPELDYKLSKTKQLFPDYRAGSLLRTDTILGLDPASIGAVRLRMTVSAGDHFQIFWGGDGNQQNLDRIRMPLGTPGESATYEIRERIIRARGKGDIDYIWIVPSNSDARVEIESFQILDRAGGVLRGLPFDVGYENVDDEIRRVFLVSTPSRIGFPVTVPAENARLLFGVSPSEENVSTTFEVAIEDAERKEIVFSEMVASPFRWHDREVALDAWAGRDVVVSFRTVAGKRGVAMWSNPVLLGKSATLPNVVLFLVDTLRADHLGAYGYERNTSSVFDDLATKGVLFERAFSTGTMTKHAIPALFSSNPISATGVRHGADVLPDTFPTLAEILRAMGYSTAAFTTNGNAGPYSGTHQGFSRLFSRRRIMRDAGGDAINPDAENVVGDLLQNWIEHNKDRNFFLYIHTMDTHGPYDPPAYYRHFMQEVEEHTSVKASDALDPPWLEKPSRESRVALYDGEIAYGDVHLGRFMRMLDEAHVLDNTVFIFTSDHGEYFGEHGKWGHNPPPFVQGTRIPLLLIGPGIPQGVRVRENVQLLDIAPTVLEALGLDPDRLTFQGKSLLPLVRGDDSATYRERLLYVEAASPGDVAFYVGDYHFLPKKNLVFDLNKDPDELHYLNDFVLDLGVKSLARGVARDYVRTFEAFHYMVSPAAGETVEVDPDTLHQLRSLGYIQ